MSSLNFRVTGEGEPVVLIHGIGRSLADWNELHALLGNRHQVWSLDLPGFGDSSPLAGTHDLPGFATAVHRFLEDHHIGRAHVVGNSLGGGVALQLAADYPGAVRTLALAGSVGFGTSVTPALRVLAIPALGELLMRPSSSKTRRVERTLFSDPALATAERVATSARLSRHAHRADVYLQVARSLGTIAGVRSGWRKRLLPRVDASGIPVLIAWGGDDHVFPAEHLERSAQALPRAVRVLYPATGHLPQVERAEQFTADLERFWASKDEKGAT